MDILFVADPINTFIKHHDSTWYLMQLAQKLQHKVFYADAKDLLIEQSTAKVHAIELDQEFFIQQQQNTDFAKVFINEDHLAKFQFEKRELDSFSKIFMRKDPPVDEAYASECQILAMCQKAQVVNNPKTLLNLNEKLSILNFPELISPTIVSNTFSELELFINEHKKIVSKPLDGMGGRQIFVIEAGDKNAKAIYESYGGKRIMAQKFIPEISQGDKRIIIVNGKPAGAILRVASENENRANMAAGGGFEQYQLTDTDIEICSELENFLLNNGIYLAGIDVIGDKLTEINITSPTCLQEIAKYDSELDSRLEKLF